MCKFCRDSKLLNQPLYQNTYARDASSAIGTCWMVVASRSGMAALSPDACPCPQGQSHSP